MLGERIMEICPEVFLNLKITKYVIDKNSIYRDPTKIAILKIIQNSTSSLPKMGR